MPPKYVTIRAPHSPEVWKLDDVEWEMQKLGAPTIRAVWRGNHWQALEGSHRIAAARRLNLVPRIMELSTRSTFRAHDIGVLLRPMADYRVSSILEEIDSWADHCTYRFIGLREPVSPERASRHRFG